MPYNLYGGVSMENYLNEFINKLKEEGRIGNEIRESMRYDGGVKGEAPMI